MPSNSPPLIPVRGRKLNDGNGSITSITEEDGKYNEYVYDQWDRLIDEQRKTSVGAVIYRSQFAYDDAGNINEIIRTTSAGVATTAFTYDDCNRITQVSHPDSTTEVFAYDGAGNLISRTRSNGETAVYHWNSAGFLTQMILPDGSPVKYQYDGVNRLTGREYAGRADRFIQSGWRITKEKDQSRRTTYHTGYSSIGGGGDTAIFHHFNHRGDVVLITDGGGEIVKSFNYGAYGDVVGEEGGVMQTGPRFDSSMPEVFAGAYGIRRDTTTGLDYMRFRWYANDLSSFISADRIRGTNRYAYAKGNPVKYVDPMGLWTEEGIYNILFHIYLSSQEDIPGSPSQAQIVLNYYNEYRNEIIWENPSDLSQFANHNKNEFASYNAESNKIKIPYWYPDKVAVFLLAHEITHVHQFRGKCKDDNLKRREDEIEREAYLSELKLYREMVKYGFIDKQYIPKILIDPLTRKWTSKPNIIYPYTKIELQQILKIDYNNIGLNNINWSDNQIYQLQEFISTILINLEALNQLDLTR